MRRGFHGGIRRTETGHIESVNLGADYAAEHEWGIERTEYRFGLDKSAAPGVPRRTITRVPEGLIFDTKRHIIECGVLANGTAATEHARRTLGRIHDDEEIAGAWDQGEFAVLFPNTQQGEDDLLDFVTAFHDLDVAFLFQNVGSNPFARAGLNLVIVSRLPKEIVDDLAEKDADHDALVAAVAATGIEARLDEWGKTENRWGAKPYYALSPRWSEPPMTVFDNRTLESKHPVAFFLNPREQQLYRSGWYTVEDLEAWMEGRGPVVKTARVKS